MGLAPTLGTADGDLLRAWREHRDEAAFASLCERHVDLVAATCRRLGSPEVEEAGQAVFIVLARRPGAVGDPSRLAGWLVGVCRRVVANQRRIQQRHQARERAGVEDLPAAQREEDPWQEARGHLDTALAQLSPGRREALVRFYLQGRPQAEIARDLGCSCDAVKTRVHEGLVALRASFARRGVAIGAAALASGLASEAAAAGPVFASACAAAAVSPASQSANAVYLAQGAIKAMTMPIAGIATAVSAAAAVLLATVLIAHDGSGPPPQPEPPPAPPVAEEPGLTVRRYRLADYGLATTPVLAAEDLAAPLFAERFRPLHGADAGLPEPEQIVEFIKANVDPSAWDPAKGIDIVQRSDATLWVSGEAGLHRRTDALLVAIGRHHAAHGTWNIVTGIMPGQEVLPAGLVSVEQAKAVAAALSPPSRVPWSGSGRPGQVATSTWRDAASTAWRNCQLRMLPGLASARADFDFAWSDASASWGWRFAGSVRIGPGQALILVTEHPQGRAVVVLTPGPQAPAMTEVEGLRHYSLGSLLLAPHEPGPPVVQQTTEATADGTFVMAEIQATDATEYIELIRQFVAPASWSDDGGASMELFNDQLVIQNKPGVQNQVQAFLADLERQAFRQIEFTLHAIEGSQDGVVLDGPAWRERRTGARQVASWITPLGGKGLMLSGKLPMVVKQRDPWSSAIQGLDIAVRPFGRRDGLQVRISARIGTEVDQVQVDDERLIPDAGVALIPGRKVTYALAWREVGGAPRPAWPVAQPAPAP